MKESLVEKLKRLLEQFEKNKEWADLVNWLNKVNDTLSMPGLRQIPQEDILAKRLGTIKAGSRSPVFEPGAAERGPSSGSKDLWIDLQASLQRQLGGTGCPGERRGKQSPVVGKQSGVLQSRAVLVLSVRKARREAGL